MGFIRLDDVILKPDTRPLAASRHSSRWCSPPTLGGATTFAVGDGRDVTGLSFGESLSSPQRHEDDENAEHGAAEFALSRAVISSGKSDFRSVREGLVSP